MRYVIYGAGATGGTIGARLHQHGHDVALIARGAHHEALRDHGLRFETPEESVVLSIPVADHPARLDLGAEDAIVLAMKSNDTHAALDALATCAPIDIPIACAQNGVANERACLRRFENVYGICVMLPASHLEPGVVEANGVPLSGILDIGRYPAGTDGIAERVAADLDASRFSARTDPRIMRQKYRKLVMNLGNAIEAACGFAARGGELYERAKAEGMACFEASGIDCASEEEERERRGELLRMRPIEGRRRGGGSSWQSLARGTGSIETDYLNGEIVLLGRLYGVPTPVNALLQRVAWQMARDRVPPGTLNADDLLDELAGAEPAS